MDCHRDLGKYFGYSKCCVDNFVGLLKMKKEPARYMNEKYGKSENKCKYVECLKCRKKFIK